jgi:hypothetical protein
MFVYSLLGSLAWSPDQSSFYKTSKLIIDKEDPFYMSIDYLRTAGEISFQGLDAAGGWSLYPPSTHILLMPFYGFMVSSNLGKISWSIWNVLLLMVILYVLIKRYLPQQSHTYAYLLFLLVIGSYATKSCMRYGQTSIFSFAFFMLTILLKDKSRFLSGLAFALACAKPHLMVLFAVYLLFKKEYRILLIACFIHVGLTAFWIHISPFELLRNYFTKVYLLTYHKTPLWLYLQVNGVAIKSLCNIFEMPTEAVSVGTAMLYIASFFLIYRYRDLNENKALGFVALLTIFVDYHWHYDFVILFLLFPLFAMAVLNKQGARFAFAYYLIVLYMPNFMWVSRFIRENHIYLLSWQIFYSLLFAILLYIYIRFIMLQTTNRPTRC